MGTKLRVSFGSLLEELELRCRSDATELAAILKDHEERFLNGLSSAPPSADSRRKLDADSLTWRGVTLTLDAKERGGLKSAAIRISEDLKLDEVESAGLYYSYSIKRGRTYSSPAAIISKIFDYYYEERLALLECLCKLLRIANDENHAYFQVADQTVTQLLSKKLLTKILDQFDKLSDIKAPDHFEDKAVRWATYNMAEQVGLLQVAFCVLYSNKVGSLEDIKQFMFRCKNLLEKLDFGKNPVNHALLDDQGKFYATQVGFVGMILIVESMRQLASDDDSTLNSNVFKGEELLNWNKQLFEWDVVGRDRQLVVPSQPTRFSRSAPLREVRPNPAHGPILFAWGKLLETADGLTNEAERHIKAAVSLGVFSFLIESLRTSFLSEDINLVYYKTVLLDWCFLVFRGVESSYFEEPIVVDLFCLLYSGHTALGDLFWREHFQHPARRRFFEASQQRFPVVFMPLVRALTAVATGAECAQNVFWVLSTLNKFTYFYEDLPIKAIRTQQSGQNAPALLLVVEPIYINGVLLPAGTRGVPRESLVTWFRVGNEPFSWSAWSFFYRRIEQLCRMDQHDPRLLQYLEEVTAILRLIALLVSSNHSLSVKIQDSINRALTSTPCSLFALFFSVLNRFAHSRQFDQTTLSLVEECFRCITAFAHTHPEEVWVLVRENGLLEGMEAQHRASASLIGTGRLLRTGAYGGLGHGGDSYLRMLLALERKRAQYSITLELLDLLLVMLEYAQQWQLDTERELVASSNDYHSCLAFVQTEILACFDSWRYVMPQERWQIGIKVLDILERILTDVPLPRLSASSSGTDSASASSSSPSLLLTDESDRSSSADGTEGDRSPSKLNLRDSSLLGAFGSDSSSFESYAGANGNGELDSMDGSLERERQEPQQAGQGMMVVVQNEAFVPTTTGAGNKGKQPQAALEMRSSALRRTLLHSMLFDSSFHRVLLNAVGTAELVLARISARRKSGPKGQEQKMLEQFTIRALSVLEKVLLCRENRMAATVSPLEHALMNHVIGNKNVPLVLAIASFIHYQYNSVIPLLSTRVLTLLCSVSFYTGVADPSSGAIRRAPSLVAYLGGEAAAVCSAFLERLTDRASGYEELRIAILDLVSTALEFQPGLAGMLLDPGPSLDSSSSSKEQAASPPNSGCLQVILKILANDKMLAEHPRILSKSLSLLQCLWKAASDHYAAIKTLKDSPGFWRNLLKPLRVPVEHTHQRDSSHAHQLLVRAHVLGILALEIFYTAERGTLDAALKSELEELGSSKSGAPLVTRWLAEYAQCDFNEGLFKALQTQAREIDINFHELRVAYTQTERIEYGANRFYDVNVIRRKLFPQSDTIDGIFSGTGSMGPSTLAGDDELLHNATLGEREEQAREFIRTLGFVNLNFSLCDAQASLLAMYRSFLQITTLRQPDLILSFSKGLAGTAATAQMILALAEKLQEQTGDGYFKLNVLENLASLCTFLVSQWCKNAADAPTPTFVVTILSALGATMQKALRLSSRTLQPTQLLAELLITQLTLLNYANNKKIDTTSAITHPMIGCLMQCLRRSKLLLPSMSVLQVLIRDTRSSAVLLSQLQSHGFIHHLLAMFSTVLACSLPIDVAFAVVYTISALATHQAAIELLVNEGLLMMIGDTTQPFFRQLNRFYTEQGERDPWHVIWCQMLRVVNGVALTLAPSSRPVLEQVFQVVGLHHRRFVSVLSVSSPTVLTIGRMEEVEQMTALLAQLGHQTRLWRFALRHRCDDLQERVRFLLQQYALLLIHQNELKECVRPVAADERKDAERALTQPEQDGLVSVFTLVNSRFERNAQLLITAILASCTSLMHSLTPRTLDTLEKPVALFSPQTDMPTTPLPQPPLSILTKLLQLCASGLRYFDAKRELSDHLRDTFFLLAYQCMTTLIDHVAIYDATWSSAVDEILRANLRRNLSEELKSVLEEFKAVPDLAEKREFLDTTNAIMEASGLRVLT